MPRLAVAGPRVDCLTVDRLSSVERDRHRVFLFRFLTRKSDLRGRIEQLLRERFRLVRRGEDPEVVFAVELAHDIEFDHLMVLHANTRAGVDRRVAAALV